jgi:hypothetical protein
MEITINGKAADITLEKEKTLGDLLAGIREWLSGSGYSLSGLGIDGQTIGAGSIDEALSRDLEEIKTLDIETSSLSQLMEEALLDTRRNISEYGKASFDDQRLIQQAWRNSPAASFLMEQIPDVFDRIIHSFRGEGLTPSVLTALVDERIREIRAPHLEFRGIDCMVEETAKRLEDLPLDIQTGKDGRAAETVQIFSNITEKIFRLLSLLKWEGIITDTLVIDTASFNTFIEEFSAALRELLAAYEVKDAVLVGDLAEYELAPRLRTLYSAIKTPVEALP